jgi:hypothetical protein
MNQSTLPTVCIPFDLLNQLATQLRQAGAKFNVTGQGDTRNLNFRLLPENAQLIINNFESNTFVNQSQVQETSPFSVKIDPAELNDQLVSFNLNQTEELVENQIIYETILEEINPEQTDSTEDTVIELNSSQLEETIIAEEVTRETNNYVEELATFDQLIMLEKKSLKTLARQYNIMGYSRMTVEMLAHALVNKVPLSSL